MALSKSILNQLRPTNPTIEQVSIQLLIDSYAIMKKRNEYNLDWDEEQFSIYLVNIMKESKIRIKRKLTIDIEIKLDNPRKLPIGDNHPKKLPRIDMRIISWDFEDNTELNYFFEAKNICENSWKKSKGTRVDAKSYLDRYISTGIENFRMGRYYNGAIIGYVLEGSIDNIVIKLNTSLSKYSTTIQNLTFIPSFSNLYHSQHKTTSSKDINIKHIFLKF